MKLFETRTTTGGRTRGYVCGIKVFSFRKRRRIDLADFNLQVGRDQLSAYNEIFNEDWHPEMKPGMIGAVFILTSRYMSVLKAAFDQPNVYFHVLEIPYKYMSIPFVKELLLKNRNRIGHVFDNDPRSYEAFFKVNASDYDLKFEEIREYVASHYKAQRMLMRHVYDMNEADYRFIHSLRFWLGVFARQKIAVVFSDRMEHGDCGDSLVYEIAVRHNVPVFLCAAEHGDATNLICSLRRIDSSGYQVCDMRDIFASGHSIDMTQFVHNPAAANARAFSRGRMLETSMRKTGRGLRKSANEFERRRRQASARQLFVADTAYFSSWGTRSPRDTYSEWRHLFELKHAYEAVAVRPREGEKYVFYALHLEPEASINNRGLISNQLWIIKALAESLPADSGATGDDIGIQAYDSLDRLMAGRFESASFQSEVSSVFGEYMCKNAKWLATNGGWYPRRMYYLMFALLKAKHAAEASMSCVCDPIDWIDGLTCFQKQAFPDCGGGLEGPNPAVRLLVGQGACYSKGVDLMPIRTGQETV